MMVDKRKSEILDGGATIMRPTFSEKEQKALADILEIERRFEEASQGTPLDEKNYMLPEYFSITREFDPEAKRIPLPTSEAPSDGPSYFDVVSRRASRRAYDKEKPIPLAVLSAILFWATGKRGETLAYSQKAFPLFHTPSSGGLQGVDVYILSTQSGGELLPGFYYYDKVEHELVVMCAPCLPSVWVPDSVYHQWFTLDAPILMLFVLNLGRGLWKYGLMFYRNGLMDAGIMAAHIHLAAEALGVDSCMIAGFDKRLFAEKLMLEDYEIPTLLMGLGYRKEQAGEVYMPAAG